MINQQLLDYIKQQLERNITREQVKSSLMANGWGAEEIEEGFNAVNSLSFITPHVSSLATNLKIKLAYLSIIFSLLSFMAIIFGSDMAIFLAFSLGCLAYSSIALYLFKKDTTKSTSKAFLGGFIAMTIVLVIHVIFLIMALTFRNSEGWEFFLTFLGIIPAIVVGVIIGGIIDLFSNKKSNPNLLSLKMGIIFKATLIGGIAGVIIGLAVSAIPYMVGNGQGQSLNLLSYESIIEAIKFAVPGIFIGSIVGVVMDKKLSH